MVRNIFGNLFWHIFWYEFWYLSHPRNLGPPAMPRFKRGQYRLLLTGWKPGAVCCSWQNGQDLVCTYRSWDMQLELLKWTCGEIGLQQKDMAVCGDHGLYHFDPDAVRSVRETWWSLVSGFCLKTFQGHWVPWLNKKGQRLPCFYQMWGWYSVIVYQSHCCFYRFYSQCF